MHGPDPRWTGVYGGIERNDNDPPGTQRLTIGVIGPTGHDVGRVVLISDAIRAHAVVDPLGIVLDDIVRELDEALHA